MCMLVCVWLGWRRTLSANGYLEAVDLRTEPNDTFPNSPDADASIKYGQVQHRLVTTTTISTMHTLCLTKTGPLKLFI